MAKKQPIRPVDQDAPVKRVKVQKIKPVTFGSLITDEDVKTNYGFVYMITVEVNGECKMYIGQKSFSETKNPWQTYTTSSLILKSMIAKGFTAKYDIVQLCKTKQDLNAAESKYIIQTWTRLAKLGTLYKSLNFAIGKMKRDRILKGIGIDSKLAMRGVPCVPSNTKKYMNIGAQA